MNTKTYSTHNNFAQTPFTTEPKIHKVFWHKQQAVKNRACALQESFFPTKDVLYFAVVNRMASLLGIVDRASVLAYLGRPAYETSTPMDQTVQYLGSGVVVRKRHNIRKRLAARKGYIEVFNLGYVYVYKSEWFIHWNHSEQTTLNSQQNEGIQSQSKVDFSLSPKATANSTPRDESELSNHVETEERREEYSLCERNSESESNRDTLGAPPNEPLTPRELAILRGSREPGG